MANASEPTVAVNIQRLRYVGRAVRGCKCSDLLATHRFLLVDREDPVATHQQLQSITDAIAAHDRGMAKREGAWLTVNLWEQHKGWIVVSPGLFA